MRIMMMVLAAGLTAGIAQAQTALPAQVSNSFQFDVHAPLSKVAPLFGPEGERCWAGKHWNPAFVWPQPAKDVEGAVFTVQHGPHTVLWVNTIFDVAGGRMQYVAVIPEAMTFTVDVRLSATDAATTHAKVTYTRTALDAALNEDVIGMGKEDSENGPYWQKEIEGALTGGSGGPCTVAAK
jgi:hypothetical protein